MAVDRISEQSVGELQISAAHKASEFMKSAQATANPKVAADWSLAAKNSVAVALSCEHILKTRKAVRS